MSESDDRTATPALACPSCGSPFDLGVERCPACGLVLVGPLATSLWNVDVERARLAVRRDLLLERLRISSGIDPDSVLGSPAPPVPAVVLAAAAPTVSTPTSAPATATVPSPARYDGPYPPPAARPPAASSWSGSPQSLLLGLGVLLILVAGTVFVAVAWRSLGVYGQFAVLMAVIALSVAVSAFCERRALVASANAFAVLAVGLMVVAVVAGYRLDFAGLGDVDERWYAVMALTAIAVVTALLTEVSARVVAYPLATTVGAWGAVVAACGVTSLLGWVLGLVLGWALLASPVLGRSRVRIGELTGSDEPEPGQGSLIAPLWLPAFVSGAVGLAAGTILIGSAEFDADAVMVSAVLVALFLGGVGRAVSAHRPFATLHAGRLAAAMTVWCVAGAELSALLRNVGGAPLIAAAAACTAGLVATLVVRSPQTQSWSPQLGCVFAGCGVTAVLLVPLEGVDAGSALAFLLLAIGAGALAVAQPQWRPGALVVSVGSALTSAGFAVAASDLGPEGIAGVFAACGVALAALAAWRISAGATEDEPILVAMAMLAFGISLWWATDAVAGGFGSTRAGSDTATTVLVLVLVIAALLLAAYAFVPGRGWAVLLAVPTAVAAVWVPLIDADVRVVEVYSLSAAIVCAIAGVGVFARVRDASSWAIAGAAVSVALLPSAVMTVDEPSSVRLVCVLGGSALLLLVGLAVRWQALVAVPAAALVIVAVPQLGGVVSGLPQWLSFGVVGVVLVVAGVRYERTLSDARALNAWFDDLR